MNTSSSNGEPMTEIIPLDDLQAQARASWQIASDVCRCDGDYHRAHPLLRLIQLRPGVSVDQEAMNSLLPSLLKPGSHILIAGAADATLVRYFVENSNVRPLSITVVDLCPAPLQLIDRLALPEGITVRTRQADLTTLDGHGEYDLILSHSMLTFVSVQQRIEILRRLGMNLTSTGRLMLVGRVIRFSGEPRELLEPWVELALERLAPFPELVSLCGDELRGALRRNAECVANRPGYAASTDMNDLLEQAGLWLVTEIASDDGPVLSMPSGARRTRTGHIFLAARR